MSASHDQRAARDEWLQSIVQDPAHDEQDAATDPEPLAPLMKALAGWAAILVGGALLAALVLHGLQASVSP